MSVLVVNYLHTCAGFRVANILAHALSYNFLMLQVTTSANMVFKMGVSHTKTPPLAHAPNAFRAHAQHAQAYAGAAQRAQALHFHHQFALADAHGLAHHKRDGVMRALRRLAALTRRSPLTRAHSAGEPTRAQHAARRLSSFIMSMEVAAMMGIDMKGVDSPETPRALGMPAARAA